MSRLVNNVLILFLVCQVTGCTYLSISNNITQAESLYGKGDYKHSELDYNKIISQIKREQKGETALLARALYGLADVYTATGRQANELYKEVATSYQHDLDHSKSDYAKTKAMIGIANAYVKLECYDDAESLFKRAVALDNGEDSKNELAIFYMDQTKYGAAEPLWRELLKQAEQVESKHRLVDIIDGYKQNLAASLYNQDKYVEAANLYKQIIDNQDKLKQYDTNFVRLLITYANALQLSHKTNEAALAQKRALSVLDSLYNEALAYPRNALVVVGLYQQLGRFDRAQQLCGELTKSGVKTNELHETAKHLSAIINTRSSELTDGNAKIYAADYLSHQGYYRWSPWQIPVKVYIQIEKGVLHYNKAFPSVVKDVLNEWYFASGRRLAYSIENNRAKANIICTLIDRPSKKDSDLHVGGETNVRNNAKGMIISPVHVRIFVERSNEFADLKANCLHEIGHAYGLNHSDNPGDLMYFSTTSFTARLSERDKATVSKLYCNYRPLNL